MTDITAKLRDGIADLVRQEAAREIDRLRAEVARLTDANRYLIGISNEAMEDARKYAEAQTEIARRVEEAYREAVDTLNPCFATADALWEGSNARKQLESK